MSGGAVQQTLTGETVDPEDASAPRGAMLYCHKCDDYLFPSEKYRHEHNLWEPDASAEARILAARNDDEDDEDDDPVEQVGELFDIELQYNVTYRFRIPAWSEHEAEDRAKDLALDARPADSFHLHTDDRSVKTIMSDDPKLPEDYDPYGSTPLWEAYGQGDDS